jgi:hypothetical protein
MSAMNTTKKPFTVFSSDPEKPSRKISRSSPAEERLAAIRAEVVSALEDRLGELSDECAKMQETVDRAKDRMVKQGFKVKLDDLKSGRWHRVTSEIRAFQEVLSFFDAHGE